MPSFEFLERVGDLAFGGPRLDPPFAGSDRDPIVITRAGADIVVNEVMARSPPCGDRELDPEMRDAIRGNQTAIGHVSRKSRRLRSHDGFAHGRVDAVGANDHVGISGRAVMELHFDAVAMLGQSDASMVEMEHAGGNRAAEEGRADRRDGSYSRARRSCARMRRPAAVAQARARRPIGGRRPRAAALRSGASAPRVRADEEFATRWDLSGCRRRPRAIRWPARIPERRGRSVEASAPPRGRRSRLRSRLLARACSPPQNRRAYSIAGHRSITTVRPACWARRAASRWITPSWHHRMRAPLAMASSTICGHELRAPEHVHHLDRLGNRCEVGVALLAERTS